MSRKPSAGIDYTDRDYEAFRESMINKLVEKIPEYTDTSQTDAGIVIIEALANGLDILSLYLDIIANDVVLTTTQDRRIACLIAKILGYVPYNQTTSITKQVFVLNSVKDTPVVIPAGTVVKTYSADEDLVTPLTFETMENLVIPAGSLGDEQDESDNYLYTVDVAEGESITDDIVGSSDGSPYQTFKLSYQNALVDTIRVFVQEESAVEEWTKVDSFIDSNIDSNSRIFMVSVDDYDVCSIEFGNGVKGKIPPVVDNGISCDYRVGGGSASNVAANTITMFDDDIEEVESTFNPEGSYVLGHNIEPLEEIKVNAPANFRVRNRCVTLLDYEDILMIENTQFYSIWRAKAVEDNIDALKVNIYLQMRDGYEYSEDLATEVSNYLSERNMIGTSHTINNHTDTLINIEANLKVNNDYVKDEVEDLVEAYITSYFAGTSFTFGDSFIASNLEQEVTTSVDGVDIFRVTSPSVDSYDPIDEKSILKLGTITLTTTGGIEE